MKKIALIISLALALLGCGRSGNPGEAADHYQTRARAFSVYRQTEGGIISHGLATALIDKEGKIVKLWRGNTWKPDEVIEEIKKHGH